MTMAIPWGQSAIPSGPGISNACILEYHALILHHEPLSGFAVKSCIRVRLVFVWFRSYV